MEITLKHRLIGITVILALIVIFVPMLFNKHAKKQIIAMQDIPQAPTQTLMEQPNEQQPAATEAVKSQVPDQATTAAEQVTTTQEDIEKAQKQVVTEPAKTDDQPAIDNTAIEPPTAIEPTTDKPEVATPVKDIQPTLQKPLMQSTIIHKQKIAHRFARPIHHAKSSHRYSRHSRHLMKARTHHQAYVVQLGSFADPRHAKILISQLRKKGFTAFGYKSKVNHQLFTRVYIGPSVQLQKATVMRNKLARVMQIQGLVKQFHATHLQ